MKNDRKCLRHTAGQFSGPRRSVKTRKHFRTHSQSVFQQKGWTFFLFFFFVTKTMTMKFLEAVVLWISYLYISKLNVYKGPSPKIKVEAKSQQLKLFRVIPSLPSLTSRGASLWTQTTRQPNQIFDKAAPCRLNMLVSCVRR